MLADGRRLGGLEGDRRDAEFGEIIGVQRALDGDRQLRGACEVHDVVGGVALGRGEREGACETLKIVRVLDHVVAEPSSVSVPAASSALNGVAIIFS